MNPRQKLAAGRLWAARKAPYFSSGLLSMRLYEVPLGTLPSPVTCPSCKEIQYRKNKGCVKCGVSLKKAKHIGTMGATDRGVFYYEKEAIENWNVDELGSVLIHELMHFLRKHGARCERKGYHPQIWNIAADFEINDDLDFLKLPNPLHPKQYNLPEGLLAEDYYDRIRKKVKIDYVCCGSVAGHTMDGEPFDTGVEHSSASVELTIKQVAKDIRDEVAKGRGTIPVGLQRWAELELKPPKILWSQKLNTVVRSSITTIAGASDYTYSRINRRQGGLGFGVGKPILRAPIAHVPKVDIGLDTSGSMGKAETIRAISEADAVLKATKAKARFIACDSAVHAIAEVGSIKELVALIKGGGGTSFIPVFAAWEKMRPKPDLAIFYTDGCGDAPSRPPSFRTIFVLVGRYKRKPWSTAEPQGITWGEMIFVDEDED